MSRNYPHQNAPLRRWRVTPALCYLYPGLGRRRRCQPLPREGGGASLSLETVDGKVSAVLKVQLGPPSAPRPGAPEAHHQAAGCINHQPGQQRRRHHRGPEEAARRGTWKKHKQARNPELQPTPPPAAPSRRLVTVVREKTRSRSSFCQLDGKAGDKLMVDTATSSPPSFPPTPTSLASPYSCSPSTSSAPGPCPTPTSAATPSVLENAYCKNIAMIE